MTIANITNTIDLALKHVYWVKSLLEAHELYPRKRCKFAVEVSLYEL